MPKISIVIPVYNVEKYLRQCLDSVISQTFTDFECICVNDGSMDNSLLILQEYSYKDNRFKIISLQNKGVSYARNIGMKYSIGEYITFVDSDDWIQNDYLQILYKSIIENNKDVVVAHYKYYFEKNNTFRTGNNKNILKKLYEKMRKDQNLADIKYILSFVDSSCNTWNKLYKKSVIQNNNICFFEDLFCSEDYVFNVLFFLVSRKIVFIENELYVYRKQIVSLTSSNEFVRIQNFKGSCLLISYFNKHNKLNRIFQNFLISNFVYHLGKLSKNVSKKQYIEMFILASHTIRLLKNSFADICFGYRILLKFSQFIVDNNLYQLLKILRVIKNRK